MAKRQPYPSDLSDEAWELIRPVVTAWKGQHRSVSGHEGRYEMREIVNAILYQARAGCQWRYLPHGFPPYTAVYYYFGLWRDDGTDRTIHDLLRWQVRESKGRREDPSRSTRRRRPPGWIRARRAGAASGASPPMHSVC